ncbi:hypothetical protein ACTFIU_001173 [Dictyostelium citrinum]
MSNRDKKKIFTQRARLGKGEKEDSSRLSIGRFANERNKVYVSKKKIELHNKEKNFKTKYDKFSKKLENNTNMTDIYEQYQDNDPMSRFGVGDDSKYSKLENKKRNNNNKNKNNKQDENINNESDIEKEEEDDEDKNNNKEKKNIKIDKNINLNKNKKDSGGNDDEEKEDNKKDNKEQPSIQAQFKNAKYQFEKEKREKQELFKQIAEKKEKLRKHIHEKNKEKFGSILKKTRKGQPIMSNQINKLLTKIMDNK